VLALLVVGGVVAAVVLLSNDGSPASKPAPTVPAQPPTGPALTDGVTRIASILDLSQRGRTLTIAGRYRAAIANRRQVLDQVDGLTLATQLEPSRTLLRRAVQASLDADRALLQCATCAATQAANTRATDLKQQFVLEFNPFSARYLHRSFDSNSL
jgi:hypothetical protein